MFNYYIPYIFKTLDLWSAIQYIHVRAYYEGTAVTKAHRQIKVPHCVLTNKIVRF